MVVGAEPGLELLVHVGLMLPLEQERAAAVEIVVLQRRAKFPQRRRLWLLLPDKFLPYPGRQRLLHRRHLPHRGRALAA